MKVKINDSFPGESKGQTKYVADDTATNLIANGWAEEVKEDTDAEARQTKENKGAENRKTK